MNRSDSATAENDDDDEDEKDLERHMDNPSDLNYV